MRILTLTAIAPIWWAFFWRSSILGFIFGGIAGYGARRIVAMIGLSVDGVAAGAIAGWLVGMVISLVCMKIALGLEYPKLTISIESISEEQI